MMQCLWISWFLHLALEWCFRYAKLTITKLAQASLAGIPYELYQRKRAVLGFTLRAAMAWNEWGACFLNTRLNCLFPLSLHDFPTVVVLKLGHPSGSSVVDILNHLKPSLHVNTFQSSLLSLLMSDVLHWLPASQHISYRVVVLLWQCLLGCVPSFCLWVVTLLEVLYKYNEFYCPVSDLVAAEFFLLIS